MARKTTGNGSEASLAFSELLRWHMDRGTRPDGSPEAEGLPWTVKEFANSVGTTDRSVGSWRNGGHPEALRPLENALFGKEAGTKYAKFRDELRRAYRLARGGGGNSGIALGPESTIHDPGLCLGRDGQIEKLVLRLLSVQAGASILVLGDAGHGKTVLAEKLGVHQHIVQRFGARRWFVELERADGAVSTLAEIAASIGLERTAPLPAVQTRLAAKPGLLVLDNLETPLHVDGRATETLLRDLISIPGLALIASLRGQETIASVPWTDQVWLEPLPPDIARTVFLSIAPNVRENDPDLDYFLGELDGIPLAIRLVAKRASTRHSNLTDLRRQWQRKGALLAEEPGGEGSRRDSLVASVEFSLVSGRMREAGKRLFSILGQLPAGLAIDDLDAVLRDEGDNAADQLRQVGLLKDSDGRIGLLSPIRDISRRRHQPDGAAMKSWIMNYLQLSREEGDRIGKEGGAAAIVRLIPEMANIGAAISASTNDPEHRSEAISALEGFARAMRYTGISGEAVIDELDKACADAADIVGRAKCMIARAGAARMRSENDSARADYRRALELVRGRDDDLEAPCIGGLADIARMRSDNEAAHGLYDEARALYRRAGSLIGEAGCIFGLAEIARMRSDNEAASDLYSEARELYRSAGALSGEAQCIWGLASIAQTQSDKESPHKLYSEAREIYRRAGALTGEAQSILGLAELAQGKNDYQLARVLYEEARQLYKRTGALTGEARCIFSLAEIARIHGSCELGRSLYIEARELHKRTGTLLGEGQCDFGLAEIARMKDDYDLARPLYLQAGEIFKRAGAMTNEAQCVFGLAEIDRMQENYELARTLYGRASRVFVSGNMLTSQAQCTFGLAEIARMQEQEGLARELYSQARDVFVCAGSPADAARCDDALAASE